jgi:hypothetical protein
MLATLAKLAMIAIEAKLTITLLSLLPGWGSHRSLIVGSVKAGLPF